ncbi:hypothetical protein GQ457_04G018070 [Hibiscus cannabinus]
MWKVVQDRVHTLVELAKCCCGSLTSSLCVLCSKALESVEHVFCHCGLVWKVWMKWVAINNVVFNEQVCNEKKLCEISILRLSLWCKSKWPNMLLSM